MRLNRTSVWKVVTIWISRELPLFNFEHLDILCAWIGPPSAKLWSFELLQNFHYSILGVSIYYAPESNLCVKSYEHLNFSRASIVQFRASRYIMRMNWTSKCKVMIFSIAPELSLFNFERLDILCAWIGPPTEKLWPFEFHESFRYSISSVSIYYAPESDLRFKSYDQLNFLRAFVVQFRASRYIMRLNLTSVWNVMTIWISRELSLFNFERLDILCAWIGPPSEKLWPFESLETFRCSNVERLDILCSWIWSPWENLWSFEFLKSFRCSISSVSIYYALESDLRVKSYEHLNFSRPSVVQCRASRYIMCLNLTDVPSFSSIF